MPKSCGPCRAAKRTRPPPPCSGGAQWGRCGLSTDRLPRSAREGSASASSRSLSRKRDGTGDRDYRLRVRRWEVGLEIEIQRAEGKLRLELEHYAPVVVREPDLGVSVFGEDSLRLNHRLHDNRVECPRRNRHPFLPEHADPHRIAVRPEITVEVVGLADLERDGPNEIKERAVIERLTDGFFFLRRLFGSLNECGALWINLESPLDLLTPSLQLLDEPERRQSFGVHPALVHVVHTIQEIAALHPEGGVPRGSAAEIVEPDDFHVGIADSDRAELDVVLHALAGREGNLRALGARGHDCLHGGCRTRGGLRPRVGAGRGKEHSDVRKQGPPHAAPPAGDASKRAFRVNRKRLSASATGRTRVSRVRTS